MRRPSLFEQLWLIWLALFVGIEGVALFNKRSGDTLSEHVREWAAIGSKPRGWKLRRLALVVFFAWLVPHWLTGGKGRDSFV